MNTIYDFESAIDELLDEALNELSPKDYQILLDHVDMSLVDHGYES